MVDALFARERRHARRAYEIGRLKSSLLRAALLSIALTALGALIQGPAAVRSLPIALVAWSVALFAGGAIQRGAFSGLVAGAVTSVLPLSLLRPCCEAGAPMMRDMSCCTMPGACFAAGGVVGSVIAAVLSKTMSSREGPVWQRAAGAMLGAASVVACRCGTLFVGEIVGLAAGVTLGFVAATAARARYA